jgi:hypothetical protein
VSRRLRLALFLAALVATTGPLPSARVIDAARADVSIAWFRADRVTNVRTEHAGTTNPSLVVRIEYQAQPEPVLPNTLLSYSLFQRPPPLQN